MVVSATKRNVWRDWAYLCGGHHKKPVVPAATAKWAHFGHLGSKAYGYNIFSPHKDGARPHRANALLDVLHDAFGSCVLSNLFPESFRCGSLPPCSPDINPRDYFLWGYLKDRVYRTNPHIFQEFQAEIEEITGDVLSDTVDSFVVCL